MEARYNILMALSNPKDASISEVTFEFLRRVVNELNGRKFEYIEEPLFEGQRRDFISAQVKAGELFYVLPEITREFAVKIRPQFCHCHKLHPPSQAFEHHFTARDPISGLSIRCLRHWDVMSGGIRYRFDAAFS